MTTGGSSPEYIHATKSVSIMHLTLLQPSASHELHFLPRHWRSRGILAVGTAIALLENLETVSLNVRTIYL